MSIIPPIEKAPLVSRRAKEALHQGAVKAAQWGSGAWAMSILYEGKGPAFFAAMLLSEARVLREQAARLEAQAAYIERLPNGPSAKKADKGET